MAPYSRAPAGIFRRFTALASRGKIDERFLDHGFEKTPAYLNSPVRFVVEQRKTKEWRLDLGEPLVFPVLEELRAAGYVHYVIAPIIFSDGTPNAVSWATDNPQGFSIDDLQFFDAILPSLALLVEVKSLRRFATTMLSTYVGREPGELILKGQVRRGDVRTIRAALLLADLRDFTAMSDALPPAAVIETLNRYFDCVMPPITQRGGEIMEIMGDGILAIFNETGQRGAREACQAAYDAASDGLRALEEANGERGGPIAYSELVCEVLGRSASTCGSPGPSCSDAITRRRRKVWLSTRGQ